mgnify:CR=1 FL=1
MFLITISLFVFNLLIAIVYSGILKKTRKENALPKFIIVGAMPIFGLIMMSIACGGQKSANCCLDELISEDHIKYFDKNISNTDNENYLHALKIYDILGMKDIIVKRKRFFNSLAGDYRKIYPFLLEALKDSDPEIVHYASAMITDYRRRINENYKEAEEDLVQNTNNIKACKKYIDALIDLIDWEEMNGAQAMDKRNRLKNELDKLFCLTQSTEEKYLIKKVQNEIFLKDFICARKTIRCFFIRYPESENPFFALLQLYYYSVKPKRFFVTLQKLLDKDIALSMETASRVDFWNKRKNLNAKVF